MEMARVLIVEDEAVTARYLQTSLESLGYAVLGVVASGQEAVEKAAETQPDLVLMDIRLRGEIDGVEAADQIRAQLEIPVVYLTAHSDDVTLQRAKIAQPFGYILKPFQERDLLVAIETALDRHRLEKELRESQERYRRITAAITDYIYTVRVKGGQLVETAHGPGCVAVTGYTREEFAADPGLWLRMVDERDREAVVEQARRVLAREPAEPLEHRITRKDGAQRWVKNTPVAHVDPEGELLSYDGLISDVTERKQAEEAMQRWLAMEELVTTISAHFINLAPDQVEDTIEHALQAVAESVGVDRSYVVLLSGDRAAMDRVYEWHGEGMEPRLKNMRGRPARPGLWSMRKMQQLEIVQISRVADLPPEAGFEKGMWQAEGVQSVLAIPMNLGGSLGGFLGLGSERREKTWAEEDVRLLRLVGEIFANTLARKQAEDALRESESRYKALFDSASDAIFIHDLTGRFLEVNQVACERLGYSREVLLGMTPMDIDSPEYAARVPARIEELRQRGHALLETAHVRRDGAIIPVELSSRIIEYAGKPAVLSIARDITERTRPKKASRRGGKA